VKKKFTVSLYEKERKDMPQIEENDLSKRLPCNYIRTKLTSRPYISLMLIKRNETITLFFFISINNN
jgi:hypothetical protein